MNFKIPQPAKFNRRLWHYNRAQSNLIARSLSYVDWADILNRFHNPTEQVRVLNEHILNIMYSFVPNEYKTICRRIPPWLNGKMKSMLRRREIIWIEH